MAAAAISVVGSMVAARQQRRAAESAAEAQRAGVDAATAEQRRQFDISQQQFEPFRQAGLSALDEYRALLGIGGREAVEARPEVTETVQQPGKILTRGMFDYLNTTRGLAGKPPLPESMIGKPMGGGPTVTRVVSPAQEAVEGISAEEAQRQAFARFTDSPGQQFLRERGQQALLRNAAAIGGLGGGRVREALQQQGIGFAQQDLQNRLARLAAMSGQGQAVTQNVAQLGAQQAANIGNLMQTGAQAQAGGILGAGAAQARFANQASGILAGQAASGGFGGFGSSPTGFGGATTRRISGI